MTHLLSCLLLNYEGDSREGTAISLLTVGDVTNGGPLNIHEAERASERARAQRHGATHADIHTEIS